MERTTLDEILKKVEENAKVASPYSKNPLKDMDDDEDEDDDELTEEEKRKIDEYWAYRSAMEKAETDDAWRDAVMCGCV